MAKSSTLPSVVGHLLAGVCLLAVASCSGGESASPRRGLASGDEPPANPPGNVPGNPPVNPPINVPGNPPANPPAEPPGGSGTVRPVSETDPVIVGAGDIALCNSPSTAKTADLLGRVEGTIFLAGDNAYYVGSSDEYRSCFEPTWGRYKARMKPVPGNHEYITRGAKGYFDYFGELAGDPTKGYYSYELGAWHIVAINSNCGSIGGCGATSPQGVWLAADLAAHSTKCTMAYWHHPRFSSGAHGNDRAMQSIFHELYKAGADVVVTGHDHDYERFAPLRADGALDLERGVRQFVVGTGGADFRAVDKPIANSEALNADTHGIIKFTLHAESYDWEFVPSEGAFRDSGSTNCH